jgi:hypothetical protein
MSVGISNVAQKFSFVTNRFNSVVRQFEITPKVLANSSPELERSDNSGLSEMNFGTNPEGVRCGMNPFRVEGNVFQS